MISKLTGRIVLAVLVGLGIFLAGRASVHVDDEQLRQELAEWRASTKQLAGWWVELFRRNAASDVRVAALETTNAQLRRSADRHVASADTAAAAADAFARLRAAATNPRDSLLACAGEVTALRSSCSELRSANADLRSLVANDSSVKQEFRGQIAGLLEGHQRDSTAIAGGRTLLGKLEKQVRGCRIPWVRFPCPELLGGLELSHLTLDAGVAMPVDLGPFRIRLFVTKEIATLRPPKTP